MKKTLLFLSIALLFTFQCKSDKDNKQKDNLTKAGTVLLLSAKPTANGSVEYTTGLTIRIPDGVTLKSRLADNRIPPSLDLLKNLGIFSEAKALEN